MRAKEAELTIKVKDEPRTTKKRMRKEVSQSAIFTMKYWTILMVLFCSSFLLGKMAIVQHLAFIALKNWLMFPIVLLSIIGIIGSILLSINTSREAKLVEKMVVDQDGIDFSRVEIPAKKYFAKSLFVKHFRKFATSEHSDWSDEVKSSLEGYLEERTFQGTKILGNLEDLLPLLGLLGTALGLAEATLSKAGGVSMFAGVGNAIGTTVFAIWARVVISTLTQAIISEKNIQLKTVLVLFRIAENRRNQ